MVGNLYSVACNSVDRSPLVSAGRSRMTDYRLGITDRRPLSTYHCLLSTSSLLLLQGIPAMPDILGFGHINHFLGNALHEIGDALETVSNLDEIHIPA